MEPAPPQITLTFDDGPDPVWTARVLDELDRSAVRATFFVVGERVRAAPWLVDAAVAGGHEIGLHCHRHVRHTELDRDGLHADTDAALNALAEIGVRPTRWRAPWGVCTTDTVAVAAHHELELVHWTVDTHDWRGDDAATMLAAASRDIDDAGIVLMHDALGPGALREGCEETVALIAPLVDLVRSRGLDVAQPPAGVNR